VLNARPGSFADVFFFSIETLATVGYGVMAPATLYGHVVSATEIISGMGFTAIVTGLTFVRFSRPRAKIVYATHPVVTTFNGQPTLMIRIGNGRLSLMTDARARLNALIMQKTDEGSMFRRSHELRLMQDRFPLFLRRSWRRSAGSAWRPSRCPAPGGKWNAFRRPLPAKSRNSCFARNPSSDSGLGIVATQVVTRD